MNGPNVRSEERKINKYRKEEYLLGVHTNRLIPFDRYSI